jgi:hypothetical protein
VSRVRTLLLASERVFTDDLLVCPATLHDSASALAAIARRTAYATAGPPLDLPPDAWSAGAALAGLTATVRRQVDALAASTAEVADLLRRAVREYEAVDDRAARRTRGVC